MSLLRAIKAQLGLSNTPANNFTLDASANNGTMKLARSSGQDIMTVDAAGKVAFPQNVRALQTIGVPSLNRSYRNDSGFDLFVSMVVNSAVGNTTVVLRLGGADVSVAYAVFNVSASSVSTYVPAGSTFAFVVLAGIQLFPTEMTLVMVGPSSGITPL